MSEKEKSVYAVKVFAHKGQIFIVAPKSFFDEQSEKGNDSGNTVNTTYLKGASNEPVSRTRQPENEDTQ